jgi:E3 ubiquitin-protein ligase ZSWIM2
MSRSRPWRSRCPAELRATLEEALSIPLLVVHQPGPTSLVLKHAETHRKFKVFLGDPHRCSCGGHGEENLCAHVLFVLAKVYRIPTDNPMLWQQSLIAAELDKLTSSRLYAHRVNIESTAVAAAAAAANAQKRVPRREIGPDDTCPICCDDINPTQRQVVFCRFGCGNSIHTTCFMQYASHALGSGGAEGGKVLCPLCRSDWGSLGNNDAESIGSHQTRCEACFAQVSGTLYKCAFCVCYHLCSACFSNPAVHSQHPFNSCEAPGDPWTPAVRATRHAPSGLAAHMPFDPRIAEMLQRDLRPEDYDLLLRLDETNAPPRGSQLTAQQAASLPRTTWQALMARGTGDGDDDDVGANTAAAARHFPLAHTNDACPVCLDTFRATDTVIALQPCGHVFHESCGVGWLTTGRAVCPVDNHAIVVPAGPANGASMDPTSPARGSGVAAARRRVAERSKSQGAELRQTGGGAQQRGRAVPGKPPQQRDRGPGGYQPSELDLQSLSVGAIGISGRAVGGPQQPAQSRVVSAGAPPERARPPSLLAIAGGAVAPVPVSRSALQLPQRPQSDNNATRVAVGAPMASNHHAATPVGAGSQATRIARGSNYGRGGTGQGPVDAGTGGLVLDGAGIGPAQLRSATQWTFQQPAARAS